MTRPARDPGPAGWDRATRRRLDAALVAREPWLDDVLVGPAAVDAGTCDRCGNAPRFVVPCGPEGGRGWCPGCLRERGPEAFCDGHVEDAERALAWADRLPPTWATLTRLAWAARGEVRADTSFLAAAAATLRDPGLVGLLPPSATADSASPSPVEDPDAP